MPAEVFTLKRFLTATDILTNLYPGYVTLIPAPGANQIIQVVSPIVVVSGYGTVPYGNDPALQLGSPTTLTGWLTGVGLNISASLSYTRILAANGDFTSSFGALTALANKALVASFSTGVATQGPIKTSSRAAGGTSYAANDTFQFDADTGATGKVLTVTAGVVQTYSITAAGSALSAAAADNPATTTATSGLGTGLTITVTSVTQGNGQLYLEFDYSIVTVPYPVR